MGTTALRDHHVHVFSEHARVRLARVIGKAVPPLGGDELMEVLDRDGVERAAVLSVGYFFAHHNEVDQALLAAENDFVANVAEKWPDRLVPFLSVNPIVEGAVEEVARCVTAQSFRGIKLHLANSAVDFGDRGHAARLAQVLAAAEEHQLAAVVHTRNRRDGYGRHEVLAFVEALQAAPTTTVQVAHMGGWGGYDPATDSALDTLIGCMEATPALADRLYFDLSAVVRHVREPVDPNTPTRDGSWWPKQRYEQLALRLARLRSDHVVFGTDWPEWTPASYAEDLRRELPLPDEHFDRYLSNRCPWLA